MIVNLYVDHLMTRSPASPEDVWNATREHSAVFTSAAKAIGLTDGEYREFRRGLLDGKAVFVKLPRHFDAMSANRRGTVYAVKNAELVRSDWGWKVALADGNIVYIPRTCGNLSLRRQAVQFARLPVPYTPAIGVPPPQLVDVSPPAPVAVPLPVTAYVPPPAVPAVPVAAPFCWYCVLPLAGLIPLTHHSSTPPCSNGSNATGVCSGK